MFILLQNSIQKLIMPVNRFRKFIYWLILVLMVFAVCEVAGYLGMKMNSRGQDFLSNRTYFRIRDMLMDNKDPETYPKYLSTKSGHLFFFSIFDTV